MSSHLAQYRLADGSLSGSRSDAIYTDEATIVRLALQYSSTVPAGFFVGLGRNETGLASNECDTDFNDDGSVRIRTYGVFQLSRDEAIFAASARAAIDPEDLTDVETSVDVCAAVTGAHYRAILAAAGLDEASATVDVWCYVAWAHNAGLGEPIKSIRTYGLDWNALKARPQNDYMVGKLIPYAENVRTYVLAYPQKGQGSLMPATIRQLVVLFAIGWLLWRYFA